MFNVQPVLGSDQRVLNKFYKLHKQNISVNDCDIVYGAYAESNNAVIGGVIIRNYSFDRYNTNSPISDLATPTGDATWLLRSLYVTPRMRNAGVADMLMHEILMSHHAKVHLLCEPTLTSFYEKHNFNVTSALPPALKKEHKKSLIAMIRLS